MSGTENTEVDDLEERNEEGYPIFKTHQPNFRGNYRQEVDNSRGKNDSLPWVSFSWFLSGGAIVGLILMALLMPQIIRSEVAKGVAEAKAEMAQQAADAKAEAKSGTQHARIALDKVELMQVQLGQKGLLKTEAH